jgi:hypothetical protein
MAMMSSDRSGGGGYRSYTTLVPYELSQLTKDVFDQLSQGTSDEKLAGLFKPASQSDLERFQKDLSVAKDQDFAKGEKDVLDILGALGQMASAELESRKPGPKLFSQFLDLLGNGTTFIDVQKLLLGASTDALRSLPIYLDRLLADVRAKQPDQIQQLEGLVGAVKLLSAQIADERGASRSQEELLAKQAAARKAEEERVAREATARKAEEERVAREAVARIATEEQAAREALARWRALPLLKRIMTKRPPLPPGVLA